MKYQNIKKFLLLASFSIILGLVSGSKVMAEGLAAPQVAIEKASIKLKENLQDGAFLNDFSKINHFVDKVITPHMDFNKIAKLVVGKYWRRATKEEQKNFQKEFKTLLVRTYSRAFVGFDDWTLKFPPLDMKTAVKKVRNTQAVTVKTNILQPGKRPFSINYRMWVTGGKWKVYDIVIEGISLVKNYRTSIGARLKRPGASLGTVTAYLAEKNKLAFMKTESKDNQS